MLRDANIILAGPMGSGKTSVGKIIANRMKREFEDTDHMIEKATGLTIARIFSERSEAFFRSLERQIVKLVAKRRNLVVAVGGGTTVPEINLADLSERGIVICLRATENELFRRLSDNQGRPLLKGNDLKSRISQILDQRRSAYDAIPFSVDTTGLSAEQVADRVIEIYKSQVDND